MSLAATVGRLSASSRAVERPGSYVRSALLTQWPQTPGSLTHEGQTVTEHELTPRTPSYSGRPGRRGW